MDTVSDKEISGPSASDAPLDLQADVSILLDGDGAELPIQLPDAQGYVPELCNLGRATGGGGWSFVSMEADGLWLVACHDQQWVQAQLRIWVLGEPGLGCWSLGIAKLGQTIPSDTPCASSFMICSGCKNLEESASVYRGGFPITVPQGYAMKMHLDCKGAKRSAKSKHWKEYIAVVKSGFMADLHPMSPEDPNFIGTAHWECEVD